jgi:hypothetical protein
MRQIVDEFGQPTHDCVATVPLSWARRYWANYQLSHARADLVDSRDKVERCLRFSRPPCRECLDEVMALIIEMDAEWVKVIAAESALAAKAMEARHE